MLVAPLNHKRAIPVPEATIPGYYTKGILATRTLIFDSSALETIKEEDPQMLPIANALNENEDSEMFKSIMANFLGRLDGRARLMSTDGTVQCYNSSRVVNTFLVIDAISPYLLRNAATIGSQASKELFFDQRAVMLFGGQRNLQKVSEKGEV